MEKREEFLQPYKNDGGQGTSLGLELSSQSLEMSGLPH